MRPAGGSRTRLKRSAAPGRNRDGKNRRD